MKVQRSALRRILQGLAVTFGALFLTLSLVGAAFVVFGIPIELPWVKSQIETAATKALGREFAIEGPLSLIPSIPPAIQIEGVRVGNPDGWPAGELARLTLARVQLHVLSLIKGEVLIEEIAVDGLALDLETDASGVPNWLLTQPEDARKVGSEPKALKFIELAELSLSGIRVVRRDAATGKSVELTMDEISGSALDREPMHLQVRGAVHELSYELELNAGPLADLAEGTKPWPLDLVVEIMGVELTVRGEIAEPLRGKGISLDFELNGRRMQDLGQLFGTKLPPIRSFDLRGHIDEAGGKYRLVDLAAQIGSTSLTGSFEVDISGARPVFSGGVDIPAIDAGPLFAAIRDVDEARQNDDTRARTPQESDLSTLESEVATKVDLDQPVLTLEPLTKLDARFSLTVHELINTQTSLADARLDIKVADGRLTAPLSVTLAEVPFKGELSLAQRSDGQPQIAVTLGADESEIGELARLLTGARGIEGKFDTVELEFRAHGEAIRSLVKTSELRFGMSGASLSYGHDEEGGKAVGFTLDEAHMTFPAADESRIVAAGSLLGLPFRLEASGGTFIENFVERSWPVELSATSGGARIGIDGVLRRAHLGVGSQIAFSLAGEPIGDLAALLGVSPRATQSYELSGTLTQDTEGLRIQIDQARVGHSAFAGEIGKRRIGDTPVTFAKLDFEVLDLDGLGSLLSKEKEDHVHKQGKEALSIDVPILPKSIELFDSDIDVAIALIRLKTTDVTKVRFSSKIADGFLEEAPIALVLAGSAFDGKLGADLRGEVPTIDLRVRSRQVDVGALLAQLGVAKGLDLTASDFDLDLALQGESLRQVLQRSSFSVGIGGGRLRIDDPNTKGRLDIRMVKARIEALPKRPVEMTVDGLIESSPMSIRMQTDSLSSFAEPKKRLKMQVDVALQNADLRLTGTTPVPVQAKNLDFEMDLRGERLSDLDVLLDVSLPPVGPYRLQGGFGTRKSGYYVKDLKASVGGSTLSGKLDLNTLERPPRLTAELAARTVQLDDFATGDWSAMQGQAAGEGRGEDDTQSLGESGAVSRGLLSPEIMRSLNARIDVKVQSVQSGDDWLGNGKLTLVLEDGGFAVDPLALHIPGGSVDMGFSLRPGARDLALEAHAKIDQLDYGILARRIDPKSDTGGIISLDVDLETKGPDLKHLMEHSNGHIDFALLPNDLNAGVFDLWAVNLFVALMPSLDNDAKSKVNCVVARFRIDDGIMRPNTLLIDSSRVQASGDGVVDFKAETIDFNAKPKPKRPQMFSAKTPVQIRGKFSDFKMGLPPGALVGTVFRIVSSPVVVPFQWVFTDKEPADGRIACKRAWQGRSSPREGENGGATDRDFRDEKRSAGKSERSQDMLRPGSGF